MRTIITTIGTSILTNRDQRPWAGWRFGSSFPETKEMTNWLKDADPRRISAETHTWDRLGILEEPTDIQVILIHSQTIDGQFCAERLKEYAEQKGLKTNVVQIRELSYADAITFNRGLSRLVRVLAETIRSYKQHGEVIIAATGGFKAEIAVSNLVGTLLGTPVYYIYEQFEQLIKIEPIPITLAPDWLREGSGKALLQKFAKDACLKRHEIDSLLKADGKLELLIESTEIEGEEIICPNILGELATQILQTPVVDWPSTCDILPEEKIKLQDKAHHRPKDWENIVNTLSRSRFIGLIRYDAKAGTKKGLYPVHDSVSDLYAVINDGTDVLGLRIETTAENIDQRRLVMDHLRQKVCL